jgi:hypothetical protein
MFAAVPDVIALRPLDAEEGLREMGRFFQGKDQVHKTMYRLVKHLDKAGIRYAILGAMALNAHGYHRVTMDVDVLLTPKGFQEFQSRFVNEKNYRQMPRRARRLIDRKNMVIVDVLLTGLPPGFRTDAPFRFPDPEAVRKEIRGISYVKLATLIELKLAARRFRDFADVVAMIRARHLKESFAKRLHSAVRRDYLECLDEAREEKRREDEYFSSK